MFFRDPKMLGRLLEEQEAVLKSKDTPLTWEHLGEMELLHNCMRETLRMYPPLVNKGVAAFDGLDAFGFFINKSPRWGFQHLGSGTAILPRLPRALF